MPSQSKSISIIGDDNEKISLPESLFCGTESLSKSISPDAYFDPVSAIKGQPWKSVTAPSMVPKKKTLIIDKSCAPHQFYFITTIAVMSRLKNSGFKVLLRLDNEEEPFFEVGQDTKRLYEWLTRLANFDPPQDYIKLAKIGVARQDALLLREVKKELYSQLGSAENDEICSNSLALTDEELENVPELGWIDLLDKLHADQFAKIYGKVFLKLTNPQSEDELAIYLVTVARILERAEDGDIAKILKVGENKDDVIDSLYKLAAEKDSRSRTVNERLIHDIPQKYLHYFEPNFIRHFKKGTDLSEFTLQKFRDSAKFQESFKSTNFVGCDEDFKKYNIYQLRSFLSLMPEKERVILEEIQCQIVQGLKEKAINNPDMLFLGCKSHHLEFFLQKFEENNIGVECPNGQIDLIKEMVERYHHDGNQSKIYTLLDKYILNDAENTNRFLFLMRHEIEEKPDYFKYVLRNYQKGELDEELLPNIAIDLPEEETKNFLLKYFAKVSEEPQLELNKFIKDIFEKGTYDSEVRRRLIKKLDIDRGTVLEVDVSKQIAKLDQELPDLISELVELYPEKFDVIFRKYGSDLTPISCPSQFYKDRHQERGFYLSDYHPFNTLQNNHRYCRVAGSDATFIPYDGNQKKSQTLLNLARLSPQILGEMQNEKDKFANIAAVRILELDNARILGGLLRILPKAQHIILPEDRYNELYNRVIRNLISARGITFSQDLDYSAKTLNRSASYLMDGSEDEMVDEELTWPIEERIEDDLQGQGAIENESVIYETELANFNQLLPEFERLYQTTPINDIAAFEQNIFSADKKKILLITDNIESHANYFLKLAVQNAEEVFYIDSPDKIDFDQLNLEITPNSRGQIKKQGFLQDFFERSQDKKSSLLINWKSFSSAQKLALNTALDKEHRRIAGHEIPDNIRIVSFTDKTPDDPSFLSRHDASFRSLAVIPLAPEIVPDAATIQKIDLQGTTNWRQELFGRVILGDNQIFYHKSKLVSALENGSSAFEIFNIAEKDAEKLRYEVGQAKALGYFEYHGRKIPIAENFSLKINRQESFKFTDLACDNVAAAVNVKHGKELLDTNIINSFLFDRLLLTSKIDNDSGYYHQNPGLITQAARKNQPLKLFISDDLSQSQWYCLFSRAKEQKVELKLYLAPEVKLPDEIQVTSFNAPAAEAAPSGGYGLIVTNNSRDEAFKKYFQKDPKIPVIDIEDYSYQDVISRNEFKVSGNGFSDFKKIDSEVLEHFKNSPLILRGKFPPDLLAFLQPYLVSEDYCLTLIVEDDSVQQGQLVAPKFSWIPHQVIFHSQNHSVSSENLDKTSNRKRAAEESASSSSSKKARVENEQGAMEIDEEISRTLGPDSKEEAQKFIKQRKETFENLLSQNNMLQLVGHSGVGKSSLIREFENEENSRLQIYRELGRLDEWAQDDSDKTKVLFIDESNIEDQHLVTFSPLKTGGNRIISHKGKVYNLSPNHKVVFASNNKEYGGGRVEQKLFADGTIAKMPLQDFSAAYIYEKILKEAIYDGLSDEVRKKISENNFKDECAKLIDKYHEHNRNAKDNNTNYTVRELQEQVLEYVAETVENRRYVKIKSADFISTAATQEVEMKLQQILDTRNHQRIGDFPSRAVGMNGILLEGDSGSGKSVMIKEMLLRNGLEENDNKHPRYYKIDASQTLAQKKAILVKAFEEGNVVWIDELNSCIDDSGGLEKILNAVLTGVHPDGKKTAVIPGFTLIASINPISYDGRSNISPALLHRMQHVPARSLRDYREEDLAEIITHWVGAENSQKAIAMACDFKQLLGSHENQGFNLRTLQKIAQDEVVVASYDLRLRQNEIARIERERSLAPTKNFQEKFAELEKFIADENPPFENKIPQFLSSNIKRHYTLPTSDREESFYHDLKNKILAKAGYDQLFEFDDTAQEVHILVPVKILKVIDKDILKTLTKAFPQLTKKEQTGNPYTIYGLRSEERKVAESAAMVAGHSFTQDELQQELFFRKADIVKPITEISDFKQLLGSSFCIGEIHVHQSPKRILMDNMSGLKQQGFGTIFLEGLIYDSSIQKMLNEYFISASPEITKPLKEILQGIDKVHKNNDYGYYELVKSAKENGIRCVGIESNYSSTIPSQIMTDDNKNKRRKDMNYAAKYIIEKESAGQKWAAIMGNAHLRTIKTAVGVSELMGVPGLFVYDSEVKEKVETTFGRARVSGIESEARIACPKNMSLKFNEIEDNVRLVPRTEVAANYDKSERLIQFDDKRRG